MSFENENGRTSHSEYYLRKVEIKDYNVKIDGGNFFDQVIDDDIKTYAIGQDDYAIGCFLDYPHFKENCNMIAINLNKQQVFDADPHAIQQINFTASLYRAGNITII